MENQMAILKDENRRIIDKLNSQNSTIISISKELKSVKKGNIQNVSTIISISKELKSVKKEMCIYAKQERHMNSILEIVQSLGQYNQMINETYDKMKSIKEKYDKSIHYKRNSNSNEHNHEEYLKEAKNNDSIHNHNKDDNNNNEMNITDTLINREHLVNNVTNNSISDEITFKIEMKDQIESDNIDDDCLDINSNNQEMNFIDSINDKDLVNNITNNPMNDEITIKIEMKDQIESENIDNSRLKINSNNQEMNLMDSINDYSVRSQSNNSHSSQKNLNRKSNLSVVDPDNNKKRFRCDLCPKAFATSSNLNNHFRVHTGNKPFGCRECPQRFANSSNLKAHLRIHTGEKPFRCDLCPKAFVQYGNLKEHLKSHTGAKPYECNLCSKKFAQNAGLQYHQKNTHW